MKPQLTLQAFRDWCSKKNPHEFYKYLSLRDCAVAQYAKSLGLEPPYGIEDDAPIHTSAFWKAADDAAYGTRSDYKRWSFGSLTARLDAAIAAEASR